MKVKLTETNTEILKKRLVNYAKYFCEEHSEKNYILKNKELYGYIKKIYDTFFKKDIDNYLLKTIVEVTQSEYTGEIENFLIRKYGIDRYMEIKVDELGYSD